MSPRPQILSLADRLDVDVTATGKGVVMAFVDIGFHAHPDLLYPEKRLLAYVDVTRDEPSADDLFTSRGTAWHGSMTTCVAAGSGYVSAGHYRGLAPEAELVLIRAAAEDGRVNGKHVAAALRVPLRYPELGIKILNVSLGVSRGDPLADDVNRAVKELVAAGVTVFAAAGNDPMVAPEAPGSAKEAITVGGSDDRNTRQASDDTPWTSSHGAGKPDLLAPAAWLPAPMLPGTREAREAAALYSLLGVMEERVAARRFGRDAEDVDPTIEALVAAIEARIERKKYVTADHQHVDGTSFASPIAAAVAAQMLSVRATLTPADVRRGMLDTAVSLPGVSRLVQGAGVLSPRAAVAWARKPR
jgi:serine protease AprX